MTTPLDSSLVEDALIAKLLADSKLKKLLPDGWFWDVASEVPRPPTRFGIVSLIDHSDVAVFGGRAWEDYLFLVKGVILSSPEVGGDIKGAARQIDAILDPAPPLPPATLTIEGFGLMDMFRERRIRATERDETNASIRWLHRGGHYRVRVALT